MNFKTQILLVAILGLCMSGLNAQQPPDFDAEKAAGIFEYDVEKVIRKLSIADDTTQQKVSTALHAYNNKMLDLSFEHAATFRALAETFDRNVQIAMQRRDRSQMDGVKATIQEIIPPIRMQVVAEEKILNVAMAAVLSEQQNRKWLNYQKRQKG